MEAKEFRCAYRGLAHSHLFCKPKLVAPATKRSHIQDGSCWSEEVSFTAFFAQLGVSNLVRRRTKISADPNNTAWANSKDNYGHRLLEKSGWRPGQFLGAENANHSGHYTAANASHIRVTLRDDNAGLGAQKGKSNADTFGLSTLSGIFGRLNGKSEAEVQKQADTQRDLELQTYQSRKWGTMNFVYGGLLVGDKMEEKKKLEQAQAEEAKQSKRKAEDEGPAEPSSKKRKHSPEKTTPASESSEDSESDAAKVEKKKQKKRSKKGDAATDVASEAAERVSKKDRKEKRKKDHKSGDSDEKAQAKEEKRARKEERRKRKEEKRRRKEAKGKTSKQASRDQSSDSSSEEDEKTPAAAASVPQLANMSFGGSRHAVRQRYIQQKRQAGMNPQAMAEILMLKATA